MRLAFESALLDVGEMEVPLGSNGGPYVEGMRIEVDLPQLGDGEWCSLLWSVHLHRAGVPVKSRAARGIVNDLGRYGRFVRDYRAELVDGFHGLSLHRRGKSSHHVRGFKVYAAPDGVLLVKYVGGNERHRVKSGVVTLEDFIPTLLKVSTV
jgi:hypothetical protein